MTMAGIFKMREGSSWRSAGRSALRARRRRDGRTSTTPQSSVASSSTTLQWLRCGEDRLAVLRKMLHADMELKVLP
jgi:hypothetical protein